jgi:type II secretory pathway pseudopilin PulG
MAVSLSPAPGRAPRHRLARGHARARSPRGAAGFGYIALLIAVAVIGMAAAATLQLGAILQRRAAEEALLQIGADYGAALDSYAKATPAGFATAPPSLRDLLRDPRFPGVVRHLRRLYADPLTGETNWGVRMTVDCKGIGGIYSLSPAKPIKIGNFDIAFQAFEGKSSYADWVFTAPVQVAVPVTGNSATAAGVAAPLPLSTGGCPTTSDMPSS